MRTKDAYIGVQKMHIFAYETRIYLLTSEQLVSLAGITNSMQRILIRKPGEKQGGMVSYVIYNKRESVYYRRIKHRKVC